MQQQAPPPNMGFSDDPYDPLADGAEVLAPKKGKGGLIFFLLLVLLGGGGGGYYFYANSPGVLYEEATRLINDKKFAKAEKLLRVILQKDPKFPNAHTSLGATLIEMKKDNDALAAFKLAVVQNPKDGLAQMYAGYLYQKDGKLPDALTALKAASQAMPSDGEVWLNLGQVQFQMGKFSEARASFQKATKSKSNLAAAWNGLGSTFLQEAQALTAKNAEPFEKKCKLKPPAAEILRVAKEAETAFRQAILHGRNVAVYHQHLGSALQIQQQFPAAQSAYQAGLAVASTHPGLLHNLGVSYLQECQYSKAIPHLRQAVSSYMDKYNAKKNDTNKARLATAFYNVALALQGTKDEKAPQQAAIFYNKYVQLMPNDPDGFCRLGQASKAIKNKKLAVRAYLRCGQLTKDTDQLKKIKRTLRRLGYRGKF